MYDDPTTRPVHRGAKGSGVVPRSEPNDAIGPFARGSTIGGTYEIRAVLGAGGMGVVYEAFDRGLARRVAIKAALVSAFETSLRSEARALAALRSPSFVDVYAFGRHVEVDYLVMELLHGERLDRRIDDAIVKGTFLPIAELLHALIGLARALHTAHEAAVSQRDLKPSNTIVTGERVVLFDFGLAVPEVLVEDTAILSGSVDYLAPELIVGRVKRGQGGLVDLYALGICAYELLTNQTPFGRDAAERTLSRHMSDVPPDVRELRPETPRELAQLVRDLLEKNPADRPPSAEVVLWRLESLQKQLARDAEHRKPHS